MSPDKNKKEAKASSWPLELFHACPASSFAPDQGVYLLFPDNAGVGVTNTITSLSSTNGPLSR